MMKALPAIALCTAALTACSSGEDSSANPPETVETDTNGETTVDDDETVIPAKDFDRLDLGGKIEGPQGPEVESVFTSEDGTVLGRITSYVACPAQYSNCDPTALKDDTLYTFVHEITPGADDPSDLKADSDDEGRPIVEAQSFSLGFPSTDFAGFAGYSLSQSNAAVGAKGGFVVECINDHLVFHLSEGASWKTGETVTFFWRSTVPPKGPGKEYQLRTANGTGMATGPVPAPNAKTELGCS